MLREQKTWHGIFFVHNCPCMVFYTYFGAMKKAALGMGRLFCRTDRLCCCVKFKSWGRAFRARRTGRKACSWGRRRRRFLFALDFGNHAIEFNEILVVCLGGFLGAASVVELNIGIFDMFQHAFMGISAMT